MIYMTKVIIFNLYTTTHGRHHYHGCHHQPWTPLAHPTHVVRCWCRHRCCFCWCLTSKSHHGRLQICSVNHAQPPWPPPDLHQILPPAATIHVVHAYPVAHARGSQGLRRWRAAMAALVWSTMVGSLVGGSSCWSATSPGGGDSLSVAGGQTPMGAVEGLELG
ncbi:hypothetical protein Dimus_018419 [Dionaea muscipula]